jgi:cobalt-zinc-cadmium efflux system membrane fusion protein
MNRLVTLSLILVMAGCSKEPAPSAAASTSPAPHTQQDAGKDALARISSEAAAVARISPEAAQASHIEVLTAGPAAIHETLTLYGTIKSNAERQQTVRARYPGVVRTVTKRPGDRVGRGETLLTIESNDSLEPYSILAPISGSLIERNVNAGESVDASTVLMRIADLTTVWAEFAVFSRDLERTRAGMPILLTSGAGNLQVKGKISYVAPIGSGDTQSVVARAVLDNKDGRWVAGQFVTGDLEVSGARAPVAVTPEALQKLGGEAVVFVQTDQGFEARKVEVGGRDVKAVEIRNGVKVGERYASKNSYLVKAELQKGEGGED